MKTDLKVLGYIDMLARMLSFARAADALGISQPALSRAIQGAERDFGIRLFDRDRSGVSVTEEGRPLIERARMLLAEASDFEHMVTQSRKGEEGRVAFGMAPFPASAILASTLAERIREAPGLTNHVIVRGVRDLSRALLAGDIEFFLAAGQQIEELPRIRRETVGRLPGALIVRAGHPLITGQGDTERFPLLVAGERAVGLQPSGPLRHRLLPDAHVIEDYEAMRRIVAMSDAVMSGSVYSVLDDVASGRLAYLSLDTAPYCGPVDVDLYWLDRRTRSRGAMAIRQEVKRQVQLLEKSASALVSAQPG